MFRYVLSAILTLLFTVINAQPKTDTLLAQLLKAGGPGVLRQVTAQPGKYRLQIIYTQIDRDRENKPAFTHHHFHYDPNLYFNPASMVKMPLAFLALEKLQGLKDKGIDRNTTIQFDSSQPWQQAMYEDSSAADGRPTIAHLIKRAFLISENDPYNRFYQFLGQGEANRNLHHKGYADVRITRQFLGLTEEQNRHTNAIRFLDRSGKLLYTQPAAYNRDSLDFSQEIKIGKAHLDRQERFIREPFDFTRHNALSLGTMQQMLQSVLFPESVPAAQRFGLSADDYRFLYQYLSQYPSETPDPKYDETIFYDSYAKFFFRDSNMRMPAGVRVFNKVGWAYGFLTDVSYVADLANGVEYMLAATLYVNEDEVLNDGKYEYDSIGYPFLRQLGGLIYQHELGRKRVHRPDLSSFRLTYDRRDPNDTRPALKEVDN